MIIGGINQFMLLILFYIFFNLCPYFWFQIELNDKIKLLIFPNFNQLFIQFFVG